jgi:hypothetical protein
MGRFVIGVVMIAGCGKVSDTPAVPIPDAPLDAFSCPTSKSLCGTTCVDTSSDMMNCGTCGATCQAGAETCQAGECTSMVATCKDILALNPTASDGSFLLDNGTTIDCDFSGSTCAQIHTANPTATGGAYLKMDGSTIYCDMRTGEQVIGVSFGNYAMAYPGYQMIPLSDLQNPGWQQGFISFFNAQAGVPLIATWSIGDCCFKFDSSTNMLFLGSGDNGAAYVESSGPCVSTPLAVNTLELWVGNTQTIQPASLPADFFQTFPVSSGAACGTSTNPALFWRETP